MSDIVLQGVTKVFRDGTEAISGLDLTVPDGSLTVLVGPSGCGKTTVLRLIAGLEDPTEGTILIGGRDVTEDSPRDRDVAMVFQSYALYPHLSVHDNIAFGLKMRRGVRRAEIDRRVRDAARVLGLEDVLRKRPRSLSGGQRQRVAMGRAIVREPQAFLMDEPLSNLDANLRTQMRGEIARIQRELGTTTLYVTHDQTEAMTLGDLVAVMDEGVLQQVGTPQELYRAPDSLFVAAFIGSPSMNLVEATLAREEDGSLAVRFGSHRLRLPVSAETDVPGLTRFVWRQVVLGVRPEDIADASGPAGPAAEAEGRAMRVAVDRVESIGSEALVRFMVDAPLLLVRDPRDPEEDGGWAAERPNAFVARLDEATRARPGEPLVVAVRTDRLHLFDPETGLAIR